jgi:hypothetical protein
MAASTISFKEPRGFWKFNKTKLNPFHKDEKPIGISYDHASNLNASYAIDTYSGLMSILVYEIM